MRIIKDPVDRKKEIVTAATELFMTNGYEKTTVENIINKLGVAKGCLYHYFHSKEEIFEECITSLTQSIMSYYSNIFTDENRNAKQKLLDYIDYNFHLAKQNYSTRLMEPIHSKSFEEMHDRIVKASIKQIMPAFIHTIEEGKTDSGFSVISSEFTATALLGAFEKIHLMFSQNIDIDMDNQRELIIDFMERILQTKFS